MRLLTKQKSAKQTNRIQYSSFDWMHGTLWPLEYRNDVIDILWTAAMNSGASPQSPAPKLVHHKLVTTLFSHDRMFAQQSKLLFKIQQFQNKHLHEEKHWNHIDGMDSVQTSARLHIICPSDKNLGNYSNFTIGGYVWHRCVFHLSVNTCPVSLTYFNYHGEPSRRPTSIWFKILIFRCRREICKFVGG